MDVPFLLPLLAGTLIGVALASLWWRQRLAAARTEAESVSRSELAALQERLQGREDMLRESKERVLALERGDERHEAEILSVREELSQLRERLKNEEEKLAMLNELQLKFSDTFKSLSAEALKSNNQSFIELASNSLQRFQEGAKGDLEKRQQAIETLVKPLQESLQKVDLNMSEIEKARLSSFAALDQQLKMLSTSQTSLLDQTSNLVKALRTPNVRGRWGEIQLQRVVEMAGMIEHCDFVQQESTTVDDKRLRPDLIVKLPGGKCVVVDAKAPLQGYLEALDARDDETRRIALASHARQIRDHLTKLSQKAYWERLEPTPEFVVLFLPGESFFSAALEQDPSLIEFGVDQRVILSTPTTLIALLRAVSYGWRQEQLAANAQQISALGRELHERLVVLADHFIDMKRSLDRTIESYNKAVGSFESRVLVSARKLKELGAGTQDDIPELELSERAPRMIESGNLAVENE